jgi:hypothetical protein
MVINVKIYKKMLLSFSDNLVTTFLSGILSLFVGYLLLTFFGTFTWSIGLILTVFALLALLKGSLLLVFPTLIFKFITNIKEKYIFVIGISCIVASPVLLYISRLF